MKRLSVLLTVTCLSFVPLPAIATATSPAVDDGSEVEVLGRIPGIAPATLTKRVDPRYPSTMVRNGKDAWVVVSMTVGTDGRPRDIKIVDGSDDTGRFNEATIAAAKRWEFKPAQKDGVAVEHKGYQTRMIFTLYNNQGARQKNINTLREFDKAIDEKNLTQARAVLERLEEEGLNLYEYGHVFARWGVLYEEEDRPYHALRSYQRATVGGRSVLDKGIYSALLYQKLRLELELGHVASAIDTAETLSKQSVTPKDDNPVMLEVARLKAATSQPEMALRVKGELALSCSALSDCPPEHFTWSYRVSGNVIQFDGIEGEVTSARLSCGGWAASSRPRVGTAWNIPKGMSDCWLGLGGREGTKVQLTDLRMANAAVEEARN